MSRVDKVSNSERSRSYTRKTTNQEKSLTHIINNVHNRIGVIILLYLGDDVDLVAPGHDGHVVALLHYLGLAQLYLVVTHRHL